MSDTRCDENQVQSASVEGVCECVTNAVISARGYGCELCGDNEEASGGQCQCKAGFVRTESGAPCTKSATTTLGQPCGESEPCGEPYPYCATVSGESYCTATGCRTSADCATDWICREEGSTRFCGKVFGMLRTCTNAGECAGSEATYCEVTQTRKCLVEGCAQDLSVCPSGWSCCDLARFIQTSLCIRTSLLDNGRCIDGQPPVTP